MHLDMHITKPNSTVGMGSGAPLESASNQECQIGSIAPLYEPALKIGKFILIAHGSQEEITHAKEILQSTGPETLAYHQ